MNDATSVPGVTVPPAAPVLKLVGDVDADACAGEFCELPAHREQAVMNRRIDSDLI